jgi:adenosylhomocysteine nucleosidase
LTTAGVVAALAAEARVLEPMRRRDDGCSMRADGTLVLVSGMGCEAAREAAERLLRAGVGALVSWGLAGGLDPALEAGAVLLPAEVIDARGTRFATAGHWREALAAVLEAHGRVVSGRVASGAVLTSLTPLESVEAKSEAFRGTGASAVDMESSAVAEVATLHGVPFIVVRAIIDTARDAIPPAVAGATVAGSVKPHRLVLGLLRSPVEIAALLRLARRYRAAMHSLRVIARHGILSPPTAMKMLA